MALRTINSNKDCVFSTDDPFAEEEQQSRPFYYPTPEKYFDPEQRRQISIKPRRLDKEEENLELISKAFIDRSHDLKPIANQQESLYDEETWPTTSSDQSMAMSTPESTSNQRRSNVAKTADNSNGNKDFTSAQLTSLNRSLNEHKSIPSRDQINNNQTKSDKTTISWYIDRFRQSKPTPRDERNLSTETSDFWWKDNDNKTEITKSLQGIHYEREAMKEHTSNADGKTSDSGNTATNHDERKLDPLNDIHQRANLLISESQSVLSESSLMPRVSTDGFSSDLSDRKSDRYVLTSDSKTISKQTSRSPPLRVIKNFDTTTQNIKNNCPEEISHAHSNDDLLYQWRIARKMELARLSRARSGYLKTKSQFIPRVASNLHSSEINYSNTISNTKYRLKDAAVQTVHNIDAKMVAKTISFDVYTQTNAHLEQITGDRLVATNKTENSTKTLVNQSLITSSVHTVGEKDESLLKHNNSEITSDKAVNADLLVSDCNNYEKNVNMSLGDVNDIAKESASVQKNLSKGSSDHNIVPQEKNDMKEPEDYNVDLDSISSDEEYQDEILQILEAKASQCRQQLAWVDTLLEELREERQFQD
ncbi:hypothetical protein TrispH2_009928 [Trichoplax sp. H2]|nr:hypothetical protein TrispH2_009928 [Trichoplax sp. H2]|eukprot:RDD38451.1 hypothetical protein TrispH2_009928 [Trichoplax sp. H2]